MVTFFSQAEKEPTMPKPLGLTADSRNHSIITNVSIVTTAIVGMTLMMLFPLLFARNLQYKPHRASDIVEVNTKYPKHTTALGIASRKRSLNVL